MSGLDDNKLKGLLAERPKAELIEWIAEQSAGNEDLRRALVVLVTPQADTAALVSELNQIIKKAWQRVRNSREPWKLARPITSDLEPVLSALEQMIEQGQLVAAEKVLRRFVDAGEKGLDLVDDSYGYLGQLCREALALWGKAWAKIEPRDANALAKLVYDGVGDNGYGIRDDMIRDFGGALGPDGLLTLKEMLTADYQANLASKGMDKWKRHEPLRHLANVADALGDVELYIDAQRRCGAEDVYAMPIARRLLEAGRAAEALDYLNRADPNRAYFRGERDDYTTLRVKILHALGRDEDARDALWQEFQHGLSTTSLDRLMALTAQDKQQSLIEQAIAVAEAHSKKLDAAMFLLERGHTDKAAAIVDAHPATFNGRCYGQLLPLAEAFEKDYPISAWTLYRSLLLSILDQKRSKAYHHAANYLAIASELAEKAAIEEQHQALLAQLQAQHGRKSAFWSRVKK